MAHRLATNRFLAYTDLTEAEEAALKSLVVRLDEYPANAVVRSEGQSEPQLYFLRSGMAAASVNLADGSRQITKINLPGDVMGTPSLPFETSVETLTTLTPATVGTMSVERIGQLFCDMPRLAAVFFLTSQEERVILMDRLTAVGQLSTLEALASLFAHLDERFEMIDPDYARKYEIPLTQQQLADLIGVSLVHLNRTLRQLEEAGEVERRRSSCRLLDREALRKRAGFQNRVVRKNLSWLPSAC